MRKNVLLIAIFLIGFICCLLADTPLQEIQVKPENPPRGFKIELSFNKGNDIQYAPKESLILSYKTTKDAYVMIYFIQPDGTLEILVENAATKKNKTYYYHTYINSITGKGYIQGFVSDKEFSGYGKTAIPAKKYFADFSKAMHSNKNWNSTIKSVNIKNYTVPGYLECVSYGEAADIWIDGKQTGKRTPFTFALSAGNHSIKYVLPDRTTFVKYINISPYVHLTLTTPIKF